ncbi:pentapeptide repeat-containing protein [Saccharopolyspora sp. K220]|uniref:pentapeptide repeat-containing protein n=1 Tax=Saccharopolyspora soli TaxID=2926618 RepID=UPI001F58F3F9|nr:pentapeptide repeat-containing protein [Saccharopolyspora soli]MCI2421410.1 pentapeptide repeat-containing protein [Saccharopolyspora soli]
MTRKTILWVAAALASTGLTALVVNGLTIVPQSLYPSLSEMDIQRINDPSTRIQLQQSQAQLQNNFRSVVLQAVGGMLVIIGAAATWRQVHVSREGQITERFTRAVDQIGSENVNIRIGGIFALERIARDSSADRSTIQFVLAAFIRNHAPWHAGMSDGPHHPSSTVEERPWLQIRAPDVQAAMITLGKRHTLRTAEQLYLSRADLRGLQLSDGRLTNTQLRYSNLARSWLPGTRFDGSDMKSADLRRSYLKNASFMNVNLTNAHLTGADLRGANLTGAKLHGAHLHDAILDSAILAGAQCDATTVWPKCFDTDRLRHRRVSIQDDHYSE